MSKTKQGLTLIEVLISISLLIFISAAVIPLSASFLRLQTLSETASNVQGVFRKAEAQAKFQKHDSAFGVKLFPASYTLFEGDTYATRNTSEDEHFIFSDDIQMIGSDEIVFQKLTGTPNTTTTIQVISGEQAKLITIYENGRVE